MLQFELLLLQPLLKLQSLLYFLRLATLAKKNPLLTIGGDCVAKRLLTGSRPVCLELPICACWR